MKNQMLRWIGLAILAGLGFLFTRCENSFVETQPADELTVSMRDDNTLETILAISDAESLADFCACLVGEMDEEELSTAEIEALMFMREEEKLARDVYVGFYQEYEMPVFLNIAAAEKRHMDAVLCLIYKYESNYAELFDPVMDKPVGEFMNTEVIKPLYDALLAEGMTDLKSALTVGAKIEDRDIYDLMVALNGAEGIEPLVDNADITKVFGALLNGSKNHLRAFYTLLTNMGETYTPEFIDQTVFDGIISTAWERGGLNCMTCPVCDGECDGTCPGCDGVCPVCDGACDGVCPHDGICPNDGICDGTCPGCDGACSGTCIYTCPRLGDGNCIGPCGKVVAPCSRYMKTHRFKNGTPPYGNAYGYNQQKQNKGRRR